MRDGIAFARHRSGKPARRRALHDRGHRHALGRDQARNASFGDLMTSAAFDVLGIGNAIVDVITHADDAFIVKHALVKGAMTLIDEARADSLYTAMGPGVEVSGGSCGNTIAGVAS